MNSDKINKPKLPDFLSQAALVFKHYNSISLTGWFPYFSKSICTDVDL